MEVVGAAVGAVVSTALSKLLTVISKELGELKLDAEFIQSELNLIQATIRDHHPPNGTNISYLRREWMAQLRRLAEDIEDCIDGFHVGKKNKKKFAEEVSELKARSMETRERLRSYIYIGMAPSGSAPTSNEEVDRPVDMKDAEEELVGLVQSQSEGKLKVISIVGLGGPGMTLLAKQVYESDVGQQFSPRAWVSAAGMYAQGILSEVLKQVENGASTSNNVVTQVEEEKGKGIQKEVHAQVQKEDKGKGVAHENGVHEATLIERCLKNKRCLIVIDDVKKEELKDIMSACSWADGVDGKIIVTMTIELPAETRCSCGNGLPPLALDSTADFLNVGELTESRFEQDFRTLEAKLQEVLVSYYESLPSPVLQDSLLYFCMFPCDHPVRRNPLIRRWRAEGLVFVQPEDLQDHDVAVHNLESLIDRNIIQPVGVSNNGKVKRCQPPRMMLEYISRKSMSQNFITLFCGQSRQPEYVRRLSLHPNSAKKRRLKLPEDLSRLRTLAVFPTANLCNYNDKLKFAKYDLLRVLDLKECADLEEKHLEGICGLLLLKYLSLGDTIGKVPKKINKLQQLETLDMRRTKTVEVYAQVIQLPRLKHLLGKFQLVDSPDRKLEKFLSEDGDLVLETLSGFVSDKSQGFPQLTLYMGQLKKVKIWCDSTADQTDLAHLSNAIKEFISRGNRTASVDRSLSIDFAECSAESSVRFLDSLQTPGRLTSLKLRGNLTRFLDSLDVQDKFVTKLRGIQEMCLSWTNLSGDAVLAALSNLRVLRYLKLVEDNLGPLVIAPQHLPSLERICLVGVQSLQGITIQAGALRRLVSLRMLCEALHVLPGAPGIEITHMAGLKEVALHPQVDGERRNRWQAAAGGHPNRPDVLFIQGPQMQG